jgi:hypothetical protein
MLEKSLSVKLGFLTALIALTSSTIAGADEGSVPINYSESSELRGYGGVREANKIEFKYKERLKNWGEQIQMGISKGWLSDADAVVFKDRLEKLRTLEAEVSSKGYPKPELDDMEKQFTKYNQDLSDAGTKSTAPPVPKGADKSPADVLPPDADTEPAADAPPATDASPGAFAPGAPSDNKAGTASSAKPVTVKSAKAAPKTTSKKSASKKLVPKKPATKKK